jgi:hypothetical protein
VEIASGERASLQAAVDRLVALIQADPNKARLDQVITRWLKRHLQRLGADIDLERMHSLIEDKAMLAENLENWAKREREEGRLATPSRCISRKQALRTIDRAHGSRTH